jgi:hypothetical protein
MTKRRNKLTPELFFALVELSSLGFKPSKCSEKLDIPRQTVIRWRRMNPKLKDLMDKSYTEACQELIESTIVNALRGDVEDIEKIEYEEARVIDDEVRMVKVTKTKKKALPNPKYVEMLAAKYSPGTYKDKEEIQHTVKIGSENKTLNTSERLKLIEQGYLTFKTDNKEEETYEDI